MDLDTIVPVEHNHFEEYMFIGRVLPEYPSLDMREPLVYRFAGYDDSKLYCSMTITNSIFQARVRSDCQDIPTLRNYVVSQIRMVLDVFGFVNGFYFNADIQMVVLPDRSSLVFDTSFKALRDILDSRPFDVLEVLSFCQDEPLRLAIADVRSAMESAIESGFFCYRAVETIMQAFKNNGLNEGRAWQAMHGALHTTKEYIEKNLKGHADERRHGSISSISGSDRDQCLVSAASIIDRYCQYLHNGKQALDVAHFPELVP